MRRMYSKKQLVDLIEEHSAETSVTSVNGKTGNVTLKASDIKAQNAATIQSNLERIDGRIDDLDERVDQVGANILREMTLTLAQGESAWALPSGITFARVKLDEDISNIDGIAQWCNLYTGGIDRKGNLKYLDSNSQQITLHNYLAEDAFSSYNAFIEYDRTTGNIYIQDQISATRISSPVTFTIAVQYIL